MSYAASFEAFEASQFKVLDGYRKMVNNGKTFFEPKIQYGTILVLATQLVVCGAWLLSDHNAEIDRTADAKQQHLDLQTITLTLAVLGKTVDVNGSRITAIENSDKDFQNRVYKLETDYEIIVHDTENLRTSYNELLSSSQAKAPVAAPRNR